MTMFDTIDRVLGHVSRSLAFLGAAGVCLLGLIVAGEVVARSVLRVGFPGAKEISANAVVAITILVLPHVMHNDGNVRTTALLHRLPARVQQALLILSDSIGLVFFAFLAYASWGPAIMAWKSGAYEGTAVQVPTFPTHAIIVLGALLMVLECSASIVRRTRGVRREAVDLESITR